MSTARTAPGGKQPGDDGHLHESDQQSKDRPEHDDGLQFLAGNAAGEPLQFVQIKLHHLLFDHFPHVDASYDVFPDLFQQLLQ